MKCLVFCTFQRFSSIILPRFHSTQKWRDKVGVLGTAIVWEFLDVVMFGRNNSWGKGVMGGGGGVELKIKEN